MWYNLVRLKISHGTDGMKNVKTYLAILLFGFSFNAFAIPALQVDIAGGTYVGGEEQSVITTDDSFTTYVYGDATSDKIDGADTYYLSVAIVSADGSSISDTLTSIGEFSIDGTTYSLASMTYGTPPHDESYKDIGSHDVYDTYFLEIAFSFDTSTEYAAVNVQDNPGLGPTAGTGMYAQAFDISKIGLADGLELHFDAYGLTDLCDPLDRSCKEKVDVFAPFSHDGGTSVSESTSLFLLMIGLLGLVAVKRKA